MMGNVKLPVWIITFEGVVNVAQFNVPPNDTDMPVPEVLTAYEFSSISRGY